MFGNGYNSKSDDKGLELVGKIVTKTSPITVPLIGGYWLFNNYGNTVSSGFNIITDAAVMAGGLGALGLSSYLALHHFHHKKRAKMDMRYVRITPHANTVTNKDNIDHLIKAFWRGQRPLWTRLVRGREWFQLLFFCEEGQHEKGDISIFVGFPQDRWTFLTNTIKNIYPTSETTNVTIDEIPIFKSNGGVARTLTWRSKKHAGFPLQAFDGTDKIAKILDHLEPGTALAVTFSPTQSRRLKQNTKRTRKHLYEESGFNPKTMSINELDADIQDELKQLKYRERSNQYPFETSITLYNQAGNDYVIESLTNAINAALATQNSLAKAFTFSNPVIDPAPQFFPLPDMFNPRMVMTGRELANLVHLPSGKNKYELADNRPHIYDRIPHIRQGQSLLPADEFTQGVKVGEYINPAQNNRPVFISPEQLRYHGVLLGKTGSGKTATALEMTTHLLDAQLAKRTGGFTIIDPKATFVKNMLTRINKRKVEGTLTNEDLQHIHYFDVTSKSYSFGLNPLERPGGKPPTRAEAESMIDKTLDVFKAAWSAESILFERFGRLILKTLLADPTEQHTILALPEFLREESPLRSRLIYILKQGDSYSQDIARDLAEEEKKGNFASQKTDALINRLTRIKESATLRRIFGQKKTTIKPREWMNDGHIVLFNTEGLPEDQMTILMGYILYEYHRQCRNRNNPNQNHYLIIDEAHNVKSLDVIHRKIIPEDREFGLSLLLMTQMLHQFPAPFFDALTEVAGTYMSCEVGAENARILEKITQKRISSETVQGLQKLTTVVDATDSKGKRLSFITKSAPPIIYHKDGTPTYYGPDGERTSREKNKAFSDCLEVVGIPLMQRDCMGVAQIEKEIDEYIASLLGKEMSAETLIAAANTPKEGKKKYKVKSTVKPKRMIIKKKEGETDDNTY